MITITIGRSIENKYVINDPTQQCSSKHAELKILAGGKISITDLSLNGTYINGNRIPKFQPIQINRGEKISFAKLAILDWNKIPIIQQIADLKYSINIGKDSTNNITLTSSNVSRNHANISITNKGKIFITDFSTNGTFLKGQRITPYQNIPIKRCDKVVFGNIEKLNWKNIPGGLPCKTFAIIIPILLIISAFAVWNYWPKPIKTVEDYSKSVVMVINKFYFTRQVNAPGGTSSVLAYYGTDGFVLNESELYKIKPFEIFGTGFLISENGKLITNRHVAEPWKEDEFKKKFLDDLGIKAQVFNTIYNINVGGYSSEIGIIPNEKEIDKEDLSISLINCDTKSVRSHENPKIDLAIVQIASKKLPIGTTYVNNEDFIKNKDEVKVGDEVAIIGYPLGLGLWEDSKLKMTATTDFGTVSMKKNNYELQYNANTTNGASGSPVICKMTGKIVAINFGGYKADHNLGIFSNHIKDLLND